MPFPRLRLRRELAESSLGKRTKIRATTLFKQGAVVLTIKQRLLRAIDHATIKDLEST